MSVGYTTHAGDVRNAALRALEGEGTIYATQALALGYRMPPYGLWKGWKG